MYIDDIILNNNLIKGLNKLALSFSCVEGNLLYKHPLTAIDSPLDPDFFEKRYNLFSLAKGKKSVLEIGFNAGHSAALMLIASPQAEVVFFDLNFHKYTDPCFNFLKEKGYSVEIFYGDSRESLPIYIENNKNKKFDLIHVDGSHELQYASVDYLNVKKLCSSETIVVFDDTTPDNHLCTFIKQKCLEGEIEYVNRAELKKTPLHEIIRFKNV